MNVTSERMVRVPNGWPLLIVMLVAIVAIVSMIIRGAIQESPGVVIPGVILLALWVFIAIGFYKLQPNEGAVLMLFGQYKGTSKDPGLRWTNPLYTKTKVSLRRRNFDMNTIKVNDLRGNPIEIAAVIVWRVQDTARAVFDVDNYEHYVRVQSESALRHLALSYPYDTFDGEVHSLRGSVDEVSDKLRSEVQDRVSVAGVEVEETRLSHLAYAPEIAGAMLQRQQADAIVAARARIVEGAVGMVEMALDKLEEYGKLEFDEERKMAMVSNLLVVLCGHENAKPVVNAGTLYTG
ncbi:MAG: membrane protein [Candidatus Hydrogenedentota bacterium]